MENSILGLSEEVLEAVKIKYQEIRDMEPSAAIFAICHTARFAVLSWEDLLFAFGKDCTICLFKSESNGCITMDFIDDYITGREDHDMKMAICTPGEWEMPEDHPLHSFYKRQLMQNKTIQ